MTNELHGFDMQSARRIWRAVKADEQKRPDGRSTVSRPVHTPEIYTMVRVDNGGDSVTVATIKAVFVGEEYGFDFTAGLVVTCDTNAPVIPDSAPRFDVNQSAFLEGCIFPGDLFQARNHGGSWYAIGVAHTDVMGAYDSTTGSVVVPDCNSRKVPVVPFTSDITPADGETYGAAWVRSMRQYVVTHTSCSETESVDANCPCSETCLTATIPAFTVTDNGGNPLCSVPERTLTFNRADPDCDYVATDANFDIAHIYQPIVGIGNPWRMVLRAAGVSPDCTFGSGSFWYECDTCTGSFVYAGKFYSGEHDFPAGPITVASC